MRDWKKYQRPGNLAFCPFQGGGFRFTCDGLTSRANSVSATVNGESPQSKHIEAFGKTRRPGLSTFPTPLKWIIISVANSVSLAE